ncbi:nuclear transport factor 2 family protein [Pseudoflavonifractor capillosus]|uniref:nuclear transport factor 2 family protein n=1 Tax=Pseudoflavonifractor capillosus TaxID=106588 RepID=UPI00195D9D7D|nr:nuclear transport factor 2 family protein [Pseudoflavonifractor capillosus]MBM6897392.1 nuclear transport factor 2 family protein [Pseudoflavonifractor capillosus]
MDIQAFWDAVLRQDAEAIREYFHPNAWVNWHNTNEHFNVDEFIRANCEYPGEWDGEVEQVITTDAYIITATHVRGKDGSISCHSTSFIRVVDGKIAAIDEYWGDDGSAPEWRQNMRIGTKIKE